jgi:hypothetical protein
VSLSACEKCWNEMCTCGHKYQIWTTEKIKSLRDVLNGLIAEREKKTNADEGDNG